MHKYALIIVLYIKNKITHRQSSEEKKLTYIGVFFRRNVNVKRYLSIFLYACLND